MCWFFDREMLHPEKENIDPLLAKTSYSSFVSPAIIQEMLESSKFKKVKEGLLQDLVSKTKVDTVDVQKVMDDNGTSRTGYSNIFKLLKSQLKGRNISSVELPLPSHMRETRRQINQQVGEFLGAPFHITMDFVWSSRVVHFNIFNNIFFTLQNLQKQMVHFYSSITPEE